MLNKLKIILLGIKNKIVNVWRWFLRASWKMRIPVIVVLLVVSYFIYSVFFAGKKPKYTFDTVQKGTITQLVTENGNVIAANEIDVYSPTTGVLDEIYVKNGDYVNEGDNLFTVRSTATPQEQAAAYSNYSLALSTLTTAQNNKLSADSTMWTKQQAYLTAQSNQKYKNENAQNPATKSNYTDLEKQAIESSVVQTQKDFAAGEQAFKTANSSINAAASQVDSTLLAYQATQNTTITAPTSGTASNIIGLTGAKVVAQISSASTGTVNTTQSAVSPVLVLGNDNSGYAIHTTVSEVDINKVADGQPVSILLSAVPNKKYNGTIRQVDTYGTNTAGVITYNIFVTVDDGDSHIKPNMSTNLTIDTADKKDVLTVANTAIVPYQNGKAVQILDKNGKVTYKKITVGLRGFTRSEVLSGIEAGTKVILGNTTVQNSPGAIGG